MPGREFLDHLDTVEPTRAELDAGEKLVHTMLEAAQALDVLKLDVSMDVYALGQSALLVMNNQPTNFMRFASFGDEPTESSLPVQVVVTEGPFALRRISSFFLGPEDKGEMVVSGESYRWVSDERYGLMNPMRKRTGRVDRFEELDLTAQPVALVDIGRARASWDRTRSAM